MPSATDSKGASFLSVEEIWKEYKKASSVELRNQLVQIYLPLVKYNAERIWARLPKDVELDDLISAGVFGLMDAIEAFDLSRGVKFETYCVPRIRGAMLDELRAMDWVPRLVRQQVSRYAKVREILRVRNSDGHQPTAEDIAQCLGVSLEDAEKIRVGGTTQVVHFCRLVSFARGEDGQEDWLVRGLVDVGSLADPRSITPQEELSVGADFQEMISCLTDVERVIVTLYYREGYEMWRIGKTLGFSESRVSQMNAAALQKIKDSLSL
jgi:RNA polymerase sigma factor for flagellar operon FliA